MRGMISPTGSVQVSPGDGQESTAAPFAASARTTPVRMTRTSGPESLLPEARSGEAEATGRCCSAGGRFSCYNSLNHRSGA